MPDPQRRTSKTSGSATSRSPLLVDTHSMPTLLRLVAAHQIDVSRFAGHRFKLGPFLDAYEIFEAASDSGTVEVVLNR
jgi:alcohol dehydrogenase